jgi:hypothetical protein
MMPLLLPGHTLVFGTSSLVRPSANLQASQPQTANMELVLRRGIQLFN